jgi:Desulfoferrodoxin, N-terminal domain
MRKVLTAMALATVGLLGLTGGAGAEGQGAEQLAAGTGTLICCGQPMVHVNAQSDAGGGDARGHFWIRYPNGVEFGGDVVCLTVIGNQAGLTGRIDRVKTPSLAQGFVAGNFLNIEVTDNGSPGTLDLVNFHPGAPTRPAACPPGANLPISQGNYVVHDRPVLDVLALTQLLAHFESAANDPYG